MDRLVLQPMPDSDDPDDAGLERWTLGDDVVLGLWEIEVGGWGWACWERDGTLRANGMDDGRAQALSDMASVGMRVLAESMGGPVLTEGGTEA